MPLKNSKISLAIITFASLLFLQGGSKGVDALTHFPPEDARHERTFMCWPGREDIWFELLNQVQRNIADIASAIAEFEPVTLIVSPKGYDTAFSTVRSKSSKVEFLEIDVDDLWARDTVPVFVIKSKRDEESFQTKRTLVGTDFNFNGWGNKQPHQSDSDLAYNLLRKLNIRRRLSKIVAEGGAIENDGDGTLLITESSVINDNRNKGKTKLQIETELKRNLGVEKIIWFKGMKDKDITDAHVDSIVRFVRPGRVIITTPCQGCERDDIWSKAAAQARRVLRRETDAKGREFEIVDLLEPRRSKIEIPAGYEEKFVSTYVNFYVLNKAVLLPKFGDKKADAEAKRVMEKEFPNREIVLVEINGIAAGGGGIHCATHELPAID